MSSSLTVIYWRDMPAQVIARRGRESYREPLAPRFQQAIDAAAMRANRIGTDEYLDDWHRDSRECADDLRGEAEAAARRIDARFTPVLLAEYVTRRGYLSGDQRQRGGA